MFAGAVTKLSVSTKILALRKTDRARHVQLLLGQFVFHSEAPVAADPATEPAREEHRSGNHATVLQISRSVVNGLSRP